MTYDELVEDVTARHPLKAGQMFGMPCLKRENGKVVAGLWKGGGLTVKLTDDAAREQALALPGAQQFFTGGGGLAPPQPRRAKARLTLFDPAGNRHGLAKPGRISGGN
jgi:hypothetical protein